MKLAFTTLGCPDWDFATIVARAAEYGFDGVDFRGVGGEMDIWKLAEFSSDIAETAARVRDAGLEVPCISSSGRLLQDTDEDRRTSIDNVADSARVGQALGATRVRVFGGYNGDRPYDEALEEAAGVLDTMAREAAKYGVAVLVETHDDWIATDKVCALLDAAVEPNIGAIWDINHPFRAAGEQPEQSWANFGRHVKYLHVKDTAEAADGEKAHCLMGEGEVPVREIVALLQREGYDGWLAYEWEKQWHPEIADPEVAFPACVKYLRGILT